MMTLKETELDQKRANAMLSSESWMKDEESILFSVYGETLMEGRVHIHPWAMIITVNFVIRDWLLWLIIAVMFRYYVSLNWIQGKLNNSD